VDLRLDSRPCSRRLHQCPVADAGMTMSLPTETVRCVKNYVCSSGYQVRFRASGLRRSSCATEAGLSNSEWQTRKRARARNQEVECGWRKFERKVQVEEPCCEVLKVRFGRVLLCKRKRTSGRSNDARARDM
jgi:hypothetical protein